PNTQFDRLCRVANATGVIGQIVTDMFMEVFIECRRRLHHEESYVKYFHENSSTEWSDRRSVPRSMWVLRSGCECLLIAVPTGGGTPSVADFCVHRRHVNFRNGVAEISDR